MCKVARRGVVDHETREMRRRRGGKCEVPEPAGGCFLAVLFVAFAALALEHLDFFLEMPFGISNLQLGDLQTTR